MRKSKIQQPISLPHVFVGGLAFSAALVGMCFSFFAWQAARRKQFWLAGLDTDTYFSVTRNAVTMAAALGVGVTLFFSYRKQQTAEKAQDTATRAQELATQTLQLSLEKHELERVNELRNRYARSADQLASDKVAIQLAGIHSLTALSDDWRQIDNLDEQQVCVSLFCSFAQGLDADDTELHRATQEILAARIGSSLSIEKSWGGQRIELADLALPNVTSVTLSGGMLSLTGCEFGKEYLSMKVDSGLLRIVGSIPKIANGKFAGGEVKLKWTRKRRVAFHACNFVGSSVLLDMVSKTDTFVTFTECTFESGSVLMELEAGAKRIWFTRCTFKSPGVVKVRPSEDTTLDFNFRDCIYEGEAVEMGGDPQSQIQLPSYMEELIGEAAAIKVEDSVNSRSFQNPQ